MSELRLSLEEIVDQPTSTCTDMNTKRKECDILGELTPRKGYNYII
jgi:hypothetical protein